MKINENSQFINIQDKNPLQIIETERINDDENEYSNIKELKQIINNFKESRVPSDYEQI
jgi:hypothetical protein